MKKTKIIVVVGIMLLTAALPILKADVRSQSEPEQNEMLSYTYINEKELGITFHLDDLLETKVSTEKGDFIQLKIPNAGFFGEIGEPQIPALTKIIAIPTSPCSLEIISTHVQKTGYTERLYPLQNPQSDDENEAESDFIYNEAAYQRNSYYPEHIVEIVSAGKIRDIPYIKIRFSPLQYNPYQQIITIYDTIDIKLIFSDNKIMNVEPHFHQQPFYPFYETVFDNWPSFLSHTVFQQQVQLNEDGCDYLVITHKNFYNQSRELAEWKHATGLSSKTMNITDIGSTYQQIRQFLINAYATWIPRPSYVVLIGDSEFIPTTYVNGVATDLWYAAVDGSDYYPDLFIGRIPADTATQANVMIQKILTYEKTPPMVPSFYQNFAVAAYFQDDNNNHYEDRRFVLTSEEVRDYLLSLGHTGQRIYVTASSITPTHYNQGTYANGEPLPPELLRPTFAWDGDANDIIAAIQSGIFILNHRDHGMESGWGDPYFTTSHFSSFSNGNLLPVVFSLNCLTGAFQSGECFCEEFIKKSDGGCVGIFGATEVSYSGYNDYLCRGMYDALWPEFDPEVGNNVSLCTLGEILNYGKAFMAETWGDPWGYEEYEFELFHCFGDPALDLYTRLPVTLQVTPTINPDTIQITVVDNGNPVKGARVCISQETGYYQTGITDANGIIQFNKTGVSLSQAVSLVVTAHNYLCYNASFLLNQKPHKPNTPTGSTEGKPNIEYLYKTSTIDADGDIIYYNFSWGDGTYSGWLGPYASGAEANARHAWDEKGVFNITVKAKDSKGDESEWSNPLKITMPFEIFSLHPILQWISQFILHRFPFLGTLIQKMISFPA